MVFLLWGMNAGKASIYSAAMPVSLIAFAVVAGFLGIKYGRRLVIFLGLGGMIFYVIIGFFLLVAVSIFIAVGMILRVKRDEAFFAQE